MELKQQLKDAHIKAMKEKDTLRKNLFSVLLGEIKNQEIIKVKEINEANETFKNVSSVLNNKKNAIARLVEINKVKNLETRKFMLNIYLNQLAEIEKKYDKSLIDYPNSKRWI